MMSSVIATQHIFLRTFFWYLEATRSSSTACDARRAWTRRDHDEGCNHDDAIRMQTAWVSRLARVVDRLGDGELDLVEQLALRLDEHLPYKGGGRCAW